MKQRTDLAKKGGKNCDVLLMSATPIPRTMMMSFMVIWIYLKLMKNLLKKKIITLSKPEKKIDELWPFIEKQIKQNNQVFWVCPLIDDSIFF